MKFQFMKVSWTLGKCFQFGQLYFNGGKTYRVYRLGPLYLRIYGKDHS